MGGLALALTLILAAAAIALQIVLAFVVGPLFLGTALFSAILTLPLLLQSVLHPEIYLSADGLYLRPMLWRVQFVPRAALLRTARHPLMQSRDVADPQGRLLHGKNYRPREGLVVVVDEQAGLLPFYRLLAGMVGARGGYAFAIQNRAQRDYGSLAHTISVWLDG